jgi:hypothetical protein
MRRTHHLLIAITAVLVFAALTLVQGARAHADESSPSSRVTTSARSTISADPPPAGAGDPPRARSSATYRRLINELEAERKRVEELEREVKAVESSNAKLEQTTANLQTSNQQLATQLSQTQQQVGGVQKAITSQFGPFGFGDRLNAFLGSHRFTMAGTASAGYYFDRQGNEHTPALDLELYPMLRFNEWLQFYGNLALTLAPGLGGESAVGAGVANFQIFPFGQETPFELVAGIADKPFLDYIEDQPINFVSPFVTDPLVYGAEGLVPFSSIALQARGGMQWGQPGQDWDYTTWIDAGPNFESSSGIGVLPAPVIGETMNPLTGVNLATNGIGYGERLRFYPLPVDLDWGRLELEAATYDGKWQNGFWYYSWGVGFAYRVGPFRTRGEWVQTYREMPSPSQVPGITGTPPYPGCCGHDNRQGWFVQLGYFLYGIPHPYLGDWLEPRFDKLEFSVRYSGVNQTAIVTNDISTVPVFGFNGSPSIFSPHAREVALALDYWIGPKIVWKNELEFELPEAGGTFYTFAPGATTPTPSSVGATINDVAAQTQLTVQF